MKTDTRGFWALRRAAYGAALLAACAPLWLILRYGVDVPYWDQWDLAPFFERLSRGALGPSDLFAQQNEYRQFFPNLIFVALGRLTKWDVRYEMLASFLLACVSAFNVYRLGVKTVEEPSRRGLLFLSACLLVFSAVQYENWLFGVQVVYFVPAACVTAGLLAAYSGRFGTRSCLAACACLAAVATFSSANGVVCWLVLPIAVLAARPDARGSARRWLPLWGLLLALCVAAYAYGLEVPASRPGAAGVLSRPLDALLYFAALAGGSFALGPRPLAVALFAGACALAAYALACAYLLKFRGDREFLRRAGAWAALGAYSVATAALVTTGRLGYGVAQSLSSRYTTYTLYLLVALVYLLPCVLEHAARRRGGRLAAGDAALRRLGAGLAVGLLLAQSVAFALVVRHGAAPVRRARLRAKACLLFVNVAPEERCLARGLYANVPLLRERAAALDRLGYLRPPLLRDGRMRGPDAPGGCAEEYGSFKLSLEGGVYAAEGVARLPHRRGGEPADAVVLARGRGEEDQTAFALAPAEANGAWGKTFPADNSRAEVTAWAFDAEAGRAYKLCGGVEEGVRGSIELVPLWPKG